MTQAKKTDQLSPEERANRAESALEESLAERERALGRAPATDLGRARA